MSGIELKQVIRDTLLSCGVVNDFLVDDLHQLFRRQEIAARVSENLACQGIIRSRWGTNDQLWDMQERIADLTKAQKEKA